jgi:L-malate glycosyltransferase
VRVVIWNTDYGRDFGGSQQVVNALLRRFHLQGLNAVLIANGQTGGRVCNPYFASLPPGVEVHVDTFPNLALCAGAPKAFIINLWRYARAALNLLSFLRRSRPDIVHLHFVSLDVFLLVIYRYVFKYRLIVGFRGTDVWAARQSRLARLKVRLAVRCADAITSVSQHISACLRDQFGSRNVVCIPNGIDQAELRRTAQSATAVIPPGHFVYCGRLHAVKRVPLLVEIFKRCIEAGCDRNLYIIGDGGEREAVGRLISRHQLGERIIVVGAISHREVISTLAQARCLLLASSEEGCPNVVLEAMALSIPVIAAAVGGVPELVAHGKTGYLFPPENPQMANEYILRLAQDPNRARAMGRRGAEVAAARFDLATTVKKYLDLYQSVMPGNATANAVMDATTDLHEQNR